MTNTTISNNLYPVANATTSSNPFVDVFNTRDPTPYDFNYPTQKKWLNTLTDVFWMLEGFTSIGGVVLANWVRIGGTLGLVEDLQGNTGAPVPPNADNVIFVVGDGAIITTAGTPSTNTLTIGVNIAKEAATSVLDNAGVASFDSAQFTVDSNGFVMLAGGGGEAVLAVEVDFVSGAGVNPVTPNASGVIRATGVTVANSSEPVPLYTASVSPNVVAIVVQQSAAEPSSMADKSGIAHFNSSEFSVDANGFVSLAPGFYSSGTFTPTLSFGGTSVGITYTRQHGLYTALGNMVFIQLAIDLSSMGSSTGLAQVNGLPFTILTDAIYAGDANMGGSLITLNSGYTYNYVQFDSGSTSVNLIQGGSGQGLIQITNTNFANNSSFAIWGYYFTSI